MNFPTIFLDTYVSAKVFSSIYITNSKLTTGGLRALLHLQIIVVYNDIALLKIHPPLLFNDKVKPVCLPTEDMVSENYSNDNCFTSGWGLTRNIRHYDKI